MKTREEALALLKQYNQSEALIRHAYAVEGVMRHFAGLFHEDVEYWGQVGLLHDVDYEKWPEEHLKVAPKLLSEAGYDEDFIRAIVSHGWGLCSDVKPEKPVEKTIYTIDELTGLINAAALMRPSRSVMDMELKSIKKKFKDKGFAAGVNREVIQTGAELLGMPLDEVITETLKGMQEVHEALGL